MTGTLQFFSLSQRYGGSYRYGSVGKLGLFIILTFYFVTTIRKITLELKFEVWIGGGQAEKFCV